MRGLLWVFAIGAAIALMPRAARACGQGNATSLWAGLALNGAVFALGSADLLVGLYDANEAFHGRELSVGYGTVETIAALPQLAFGIAEMRSTTGASRTWFGVYTGLAALMAGHGIWTIGRGLSHPAAPEPPPPSLLAGTSFAVGPTYVPLTDRPAPSFGLSGRF